MRVTRRNCRRVALTTLTAASVAVLGAGMTASAQNFGKPGEPVELVVGHPCCYTEVWSVMALRGKEFWKKYLPSGSSIKYEIGLQG
jgi:NitT/TauT family transport system substrate-binding protein